MLDFSDLINSEMDWEPPSFTATNSPQPPTNNTQNYLTTPPISPQAQRKLHDRIINQPPTPRVPQKGKKHDTQYQFKKPILQKITLIYRCLECSPPLPLKSSDELAAHQLACHLTNVPSVPCLSEICSKKFLTEAERNLHFASVHTTKQ